MNMYAVTAQLLTSDGPWSGSRQIPTFYLNPRVQGITSAAHAVTVADMIINPLGIHQTSIHAELVTLTDEG